LAQPAATELGRLALYLDQEQEPGAKGFLGRLTALWNDAAATGEIEARDLYLMHSALFSQNSAAAHRLRAGLRICIARRDEQSWLAFLALTCEIGSTDAVVGWLGPSFDPLSLIQVADFHLAPYRASRLLELFKNDASSRDAAFRRIIETHEHSNANILLSVLLKLCPGDAAAQQCALDWLGNNLKQPQGAWLLKPLLKVRPRERLLRQYALAWIQANLNHPQSYYVLKLVIADNPGNSTVRKSLLEWAQNSNHPSIRKLIEFFIIANLADETLRQSVLERLRNNPGDLQNHRLLAPLIKGSPGDKNVQEIAMSWVIQNSNHHQSYKIYKILVKANADDGVFIQNAIHLIESRPADAQAHKFLAPLAKSNPEDKRVRKYALSWIRDNPESPQGYQLLAWLIRANSGDQELQQCALEMIQINPLHQQIYRLPAALIACTGSNEMLRLGEALVANPQQPGRTAILAELLSAGEVEPRYIDLAIEYLILRKTGSMSNTKRRLLHSLAFGIKRHPQSLVELLRGRIEVLSSDDANALIVFLLDIGVESEELTKFIAKRLAVIFERRGYGFIHRAVRRNPTVRESLLSLRELDFRVRSDLNDPSRFSSQADESGAGEGQPHKPSGYHGPFGRGLKRR
jgi:hypothetical protein